MALIYWTYPRETSHFGPRQSIHLLSLQSPRRSCRQAWPPAPPPRPPTCCPSSPSSSRPRSSSCSGSARRTRQQVDQSKLYTGRARPACHDLKELLCQDNESPLAEINSFFEILLRLYQTYVISVHVYEYQTFKFSYSLNRFSFQCPYIYTLFLDFKIKYPSKYYTPRVFLIIGYHRLPTVRQLK